MPSRAKQMYDQVLGRPQADHSTGSDAEVVLRSELYGKAGTDGPAVEVSGYVEALETFTWLDQDGYPGFARARDHGKPGTIVSADHPVVKSHPNYFQPLRVAIDMPWPPVTPQPLQED
jgi:hypothetical protein